MNINLQQFLEQIITENDNSASLFKRAGAFLIDLLISAFIILIIIKVMQLTGLIGEEVNGSRAEIIDQTIWGISFLLYNLLFYSKILLKIGPNYNLSNSNNCELQTLGKRICNIKVQSNSFIHLFLREFIKIMLLILVVLTGNLLITLLFVINLLLPVFPGRITLHDLFTKSKVIKSDN